MRFVLSVICFVQFVFRVHAFHQDSLILKNNLFHSANNLPPSCQSRIYCESDLLNDVQLSQIYPDSKTFVDKKLMYTESEILAKYQKLKEQHNNAVPPKAELTKFIDENFEDGNELEEWTPSDFTENPSIANRVKDQNYKKWALELNHIWKTLARKVKDDVRVHPDKYSLLWTPNGFVIPGGRFRELYYWDTYWIVNGLLLCDMKATAKGVISNILSLVKKFGFMPNGARIYYLDRTQPPMVILMVLAYYKATNDFDYVKSVLPDLEVEFDYWMRNRMVQFQKDGKTYKMARYYAPSRGPRPESYREDYKLAEHLSSEDEKNNLYINIKSGAETGWDFSSRWFISANGSNRGNLTDIQTSSIIPVDLNSLLQVNAMTLSTWFDQIGSKYKAKKYNNISQEFLVNIQEVMWNADRGVWFDWDIKSQKSRDYFFASNLVPLWTGGYNMTKESAASAVLKYLLDQRIIESDYRIAYNGTPTSLFSSSQQWDLPNAWPPLQAFIVQGLDRTQQKLAQEVAFKLAKVWLHSNYKGFADHHMMFEKYDVFAAGETGGGGEYNAQKGFGWTNGVVLEFLNRWGDSATYS